MDEALRWSDIEERLDGMPRGSRSALARLLRMDRSQLAKILRTDKYPTVPQWRVIERFFEGPAEVATGSGEASMPFAHDVTQVPVYGYAAATSGDRLAFNEGQLIDMMTLPRGVTVSSPDFFVVQALGPSMEPRIWAGERRLVRRGVPPRRGEDVVIEFNDGTAVIKTYRTERDGRVFAEQYNPPQEVSYDASSVKAYHAIFPL